MGGGGGGVRRWRVEQDAKPPQSQHIDGDYYVPSMPHRASACLQDRFRDYHKDLDGHTSHARARPSATQHLSFARTAHASTLCYTATLTYSTTTAIVATRTAIATAATGCFVRVVLLLLLLIVMLLLLLLARSTAIFTEAHGHHDQCYSDRHSYDTMV